MLRSRMSASLALMIVGLAALPALAQQASKPEPAAPSPATAPAPAAAPIGSPPRTIINNTFNPTGPTGTGTFSPTAEFIVCVNDGEVRGAHAAGMTGMMSAKASHVEGRIAFLKAELKITAAQQALWEPVAGAMRDQAKSMAPASGEKTGPLPQRLAALEKVMTARLEAVRKLKAATDPLYATLTDEQKKLADELTSDMGDGVSHP